MKKKKTLYSIIVLIIIIAGLYLFFFKKEKAEYSLAEVVRGQISQEVSETGAVKMGEEINLTFKNSGKIEKIYVKAGDEVKSGESLAKLDTNQLVIQLTEAQANLEVAQAQLNQLLAGSSPEEIRAAETEVSNAKIALENAKQNLEDVTTDAREDLDSAYEDALNTLDDSYLKAYNAYNDVKEIQRTYFGSSDQEGLSVQENRDKINNNLNQMENYLDIAKADSSDENIDSALAEFKIALDNVYDALTVIREKTETINYRDIVSSVDKDSLDTHKTNINTALTNVTNAQQTNSSTKITNTANINQAQAKVSTAEGNLKIAEDNLALVLAKPRQEDIDLYQAKVKQAQAKVNLLYSQIKEATITSPVAARVAKIEKEIGEIVQPTETVVSLIPSSPFQIEVDIYEEDVVKVEIGNPVDIKLTALPEKVFQGKVISIDPAEKLIEGVVYYEVTIDFEKAPENIKPGMTADIVIKTAQKENVLIIPEEAIQKKNGKVIVEVLENGEIIEKEINTGLEGSDDMIEVISGLTEGERVVVHQ